MFYFGFISNLLFAYLIVDLPFSFLLKNLKGGSVLLSAAVPLIVSLIAGCLFWFLFEKGVNGFGQLLGYFLIMGLSPLAVWGIFRIFPNRKSNVSYLIPLLMISFCLSIGYLLIVNFGEIFK